MVVHGVLSKVTSRRSAEPAAPPDTRRHTGHHGAARAREPECASPGVSGCIDTPSQPRDLAPLESCEDPARHVGRNGEADALSRGDDRGVDADDLAAEIHDGPPELPGLIDASVWTKFS